MYNKFLGGHLQMIQILLTTGTLDQANLHDFTLTIQNIDGFAGKLNLFLIDWTNFYKKYDKYPQSLVELRDFVLDKIGADPEAYLFDKKEFKRNGRFVIKQVAPIRYLYEFLSENDLGFGCYALDKNEIEPFDDIKIYCPVKLITREPSEMKSYLELAVVKTQLSF